MRKLSSLSIQTSGIHVLVSVLLLAWSGGVWAACNKKIIVGWEPWAPYQFMDANNQLTGLDIELVAAIVKNMGCTIGFKEAPWKRQLKEIEKGTIDLVVAASKTPERQTYANFSNAYRNEFTALYVRKGEAGEYKIKSLKDIVKISEFILGVTRGYFYGDEFTKLEKTPEFKKHLAEVQDNAKNYEKLIRKRVDGFLADPISVPIVLKEKKLTNRIERHPMSAVLTGDIFFMLSKQSVKTSMVRDFNQSLTQLKANGTYQKIVDRYSVN